MSSEKMQILKMLEEGKITAEEASRLLQSVGQPPKSDYADNRSTARGTAGQSTAGQSTAGQSTNGQNTAGRAASGTKTFSGFDDFAGDLGRKFETLAKDMEPRLQKLVGTVAEKTADVADIISRNINDSHSSRRTGSAVTVTPHRQKPSPGAAADARSYELKVESGYNELSLTGFNGDISVNGYNGDKITLRVFAKEQRNSSRIELMRLGSRYYLSYNEDDFKSVSIDALVPERMFDSVVIGTTGGRVAVENISAEYLTVRASGGMTTARGIRSENFSLETANGDIKLTDLSAKNANIEGANGAIEANYIDAANLRMFTSNGAVIMNAADFGREGDYIWIIETSNGRITMNVPSSPRIGYHVRVNTSLENVRVGLPGLSYITNLPNSVEAISNAYDSAVRRVKLSAETSNAGLSVN